MVSAAGQIRLAAAGWGAVSSVVFSVPVAIAVGLLDRNGDGDLGLDTVLKLALLLLSASFAGYAAGRTARTGFGVNGAIAGAAVFLVVQITYSAARGSWSSTLAFVYAVLLGACLGTLGGIFASRQTVAAAEAADGEAPEVHGDADHQEGDR